MAFPNTPLEITSEIQVGGAWNGISDDVRNREAVAIFRGRRDEGSRVDPGTCTLQLNNGRSKVNPAVVGRYSPRHPASDLYGLIGRNTPLRVSVHAGTPYLDMDGDPANYASTPDHASLDLAGDLDLRAEVTMNWQEPVDNQVLIAKWGAASDQRSYTMRILNGGLYVNWSTDGVNSRFAGAALPALPKRAAVRVTLDVDNGAGGIDAGFYWAETLDGPWTLIATVRDDTFGPQTIHVGTAPLTVGGSDPTTTPPRVPFTGHAHRAEVRDGIDGTIVANPNFTIQAIGATTFADSAGRTWTLAGTAEITDRRIRFHGEISAWPPHWDPSGADMWVSAQAAGILRRLGQGRKALDSTLRRRIPSGAPLAYWPMEEDDTATQAYSPIVGVDPLTVADLDFAADDSLAGSAALPTLGAAASIAGTVPASATGDTGEWQVQFVYWLESLPASLSTMMEITTTGTVRTHRLQVQTNNVRLEGLDATGAQVYLINVTAPGFTGTWNRLLINATPDGADVLVTLWWGTIGGSGFVPTATYAGSAGRVTDVGATPFGAGLEGMRIGHLAVFEDSDSTIYDDADRGFAGESALTRMRRLADEEDFPLVTYDGDRTISSQSVGPQRPGTVLDLIRDAADVDGGILYEARDALQLLYRDRTSLYNQPVKLALDYTAPGEVPPPLEPVDDDQATRNDVTVKRRGGSSARVVDETSALSVLPPPDGVGRYDEEIELNLSSDDQPEPHAAWRVHLGTWDEARYPTVRVNLAAAPHLIDDLVDLDIGDRIQIANLPAGLPPDTVDLIVQGYSETLSLTTWELELICTPAGPWTVAVTDDDLLGLVDTDGSELAAGIDADDTTLSVTVTTGPLWTTSPGEMPVDIAIGGERMTVTAITGTSSPQAFTVTRSVNGVVKAHAAGAAIRLFQPATVAL